jgi:NAD(P)-dependent dehydrogenase (short-subunit alcohol dehydrogenase family)
LSVRRFPHSEGVGTDLELTDKVGIGGFATGRFTTPEEVATLIACLASPRTGSVTGVNYIVDGGLMKTT